MLKKERKKEAARDQAFSDQGEAFMQALSGGLGSALRKVPRDRQQPELCPISGAGWRAGAAEGTASKKTGKDPGP